MVDRGGKYAATDVEPGHRSERARPVRPASDGDMRCRRCTQRPFVRIKTAEQQGLMALYVIREGFKDKRITKRDDTTSRWPKHRIKRVGRQKACAAMAKKNARILWAVMTRAQGFDAQHVSAKPLAKQNPAPAPALALALAPELAAA